MGNIPYLYGHLHIQKLSVHFELEILFCGLKIS